MSSILSADGLTPDERAMVRRIAGDWKLTPATFAHKISRGQWIPAPHLMYISSRIAKRIAAGNARIIISAPPRHGKSQLSSIYTPAWVLERFPQFKTILAGYGADLATGFSRQVRDIFQDGDNAALLNTRIRKDSSRVEAFLTEQGGGMYAVGLGGAITGRGANVLLIDDYIKEIKEALSPAYRDYIWNWFVTTAFTRLEPNGSCIIIATRWHSDDLIGRILQNFPEQWEYIEIPAIAEAGDLLGRTPGEALFPERYPIEKLLELKETLGGIFFQALFQQKPVDESKKMTDSRWIKTVQEKDIHYQVMQDVQWARVWDLAATEGGGDYTVGSKLGHTKKHNHTYIANVFRKQLSPGQVEEKVREFAIQDGVDVKIYIEQEPGSSGIALIDHYKRNVLPEFTVEAVPAVNNKLVRAQPFLAAAESGNVSKFEGVWNETWDKEFDSFPGGENDDQVDTVGAGYQKLSGKRIFSASWGRAAKKGTANSNATKQASVSMSLRSRGPVRGATFGRRRM
jgi:predicted phage terminase large subunit-like protein